MAYHRLESVVDQHLTQDMANYQLSRSLVSVGYYVNVETRSSIAHSHPYYELILVRRGVCEYLSGGARFHLHPDELLFISPSTVHTMICPEDSESYERLILQINADFMTQVLELYRLDGSKLPPLYILRAESVCRWGLRELVERINASASVTDSELREQLYRCQIGELMLTVKHIARASKSVVPNASSTLVSGVTAYIQEQYRDPELNVAGIARFLIRVHSRGCLPVRPGRKRVVIGDCQSVSVSSQRLESQLRRESLWREVQECEIDLPLGKQVGQLVGPKLADAEGNIRIGVDEGREHGTEFNALKAGDEAESQGSPVEARVGRHGFLKSFGIAEDLPGSPDKFGTCFRQDGASGVPVKQAHAQLFFQPRDLLGQCGLSDVTDFRCLAEIPAVCDIDHVIHNGEIHVLSPFRYRDQDSEPANTISLRQQDLTSDYFDCPGSVKKVSLFVIPGLTRDNWILRPADHKL